MLVTAAVMVSAVLSACSDCRTSNEQPLRSPTGALVAATYSYACGPIPPFNWHVGVRHASGASYQEIVSIRDAAFEAHIRWETNDTLLVIFECSENPAAACAPPKDRYWSVSSTSRWDGVRVRYEIGPRLERQLDVKDQEKLLQPR
jgi:hypothetical protein